MIWNKDEILKELRRLHKAGANLSYNGLASAKQPLVSAAAYHFGSYRRAVELAGIEYATVLRRPRWTRTRIVSLIKSAHKQREELHWSAVTHRRDELGKAAFASLQPRLFGQWQKALGAAGLKSEDVARYRRWTRKSIAAELKSRSRRGKALSSGSLQQDDPGLHAAAVRHFGAYDAALRAAGLDPQKVRRRQSWNKSLVIKTIKSSAKAGKNLADNRVRREYPALYGAAIRLFGSFTAARSTAGVKFRPKKRGSKV
jgi:hypothetical protein